MKIIGIYVIFNRISKKVYIGSSFDIKDRIYTHLLRLRKNKHENKHLQYAFNKYKEESFKFTCIKVFDNISDKELRLQEQTYIDKIKEDRLYNQCLVAGSTKGKRHSSETKDKIRKTLQKRHNTQPKIPKIRNSICLKARKTVFQIDKNTNEIINIFVGTQEASKQTGVLGSDISKVCHGVNKTAGGFIWKYKNSQGIV